MGPNSIYAWDSSSETFCFPKLNSTNYHVWSDNMKAALQAHLLWLFVKGLEEYPSKPSSGPPINMDNKSLIPTLLEYKEWTTLKKEYLDWLCSDSAAMGLMWDAIKFGQCEHIIGTSTSKNMWDHLYSIHVTQCQGINVHYYYQELYTKKWDEQITMSEYIGLFLYLCHYINNYEQKLDDIHIVYIILLSLPWSGVWDVMK